MIFLITECKLYKHLKKGIMMCINKNVCLPKMESSVYGWEKSENNLNNWSLRWKKGARFFTQNWTLSKTLQISHAVLFRCVKQCSVCFLLKFSSFTRYYVCKKACICGKTVISLIIQQNIDLLQRVTFKNVDFKQKH